MSTGDISAGGGVALRDRVDLIPRNNWDYGVRALFTAASGEYRRVSRAPNFAALFGQDPIWTNTGRTSLYAILRALDLPEGAAVGVPLFCCSVVFEAICQAGLRPRFLDSDLDDWNLSVEDLRDKRDDLAAIVPVHMFGNPVNMDAVSEAADGLPVIEDCAHSLLSTYKGDRAGLLATASFFSFRCGKYISAGEGSAILCRDPELRRTIEQVADSFPRTSTPAVFSSSLSTLAKATLYNRPWYGLIGHPVGMRLDAKLNLTAKNGFETGQITAAELALIDQRIPGFPASVERQRRHARVLLESVTPGPFDLPVEGPDYGRNWFQFPLRFHTTEQRDRMAEHLLARGIDTAKYLDDITDEARAQYGYHGDCPNAELLSRTTLLVPIHYSLDRRDVEHIAHSINEGARILESAKSRTEPPMSSTTSGRVKKKLLKLTAKQLPGAGMRIKLLRMCGYVIGEQVYVGEDVIIIDDLGESQFNLRIGDRSSISPRVTFVLHTQPNESRITPYVNSHKGDITLESDVWIGTGSVILPGVTIGEGAVVGANSVVTESVPPYSMVGGVPAKKIKDVVVPWHRSED